MQAIVLARVSTEEQMQEGFSIPAQIDRMRKYCAAKNLPIKAEYSFNESSTKEHREQFSKIIEELKNSKQKIALIVETVDRLQRSFKESVLLDELRKQDKIEIHFLRENLILNSSSSSADLIRWDMGVMFARSYVLQLSDNVKRSYKQKLAQGEIWGKAPVGYRNIIKDTGAKDVIIDKERAYIVKQAFEDYATGNYSLNDIVHRTAAQGLTILGTNKKPARSYIYHMLQNPFYIGINRTRKGEEYRHKYPKLVDEQIFNRCQAVMKGYDKKLAKYASKPFIFRGLIKCACCGATMSVDFKKQDKYIYMYCNNAKMGKCTNTAWVRQEVILEQVKGVFRNIQLPQDLQIEIKEYLQKAHDNKNDFRKGNINTLQAELAKIQQDIDGTMNLIIKLQTNQASFMGCITEEDCTKKMQELKRKQYDISERINEHLQADEKFNISLLTVLDLAKNAYGLFESSQIEEKRQLLNFITTNLTMEGKKLHFTYKKPFDMLAKGYDCSKMLLG